MRSNFLLNVLLFVSFCILSSASFGQKKFLLETDAGYSYTGSGDMSGWGLKAGLGYYVANRVVAGLGYQHNNFEESNDHYNGSANINMGQIYVRVEALKTKRFSFDIGPLVFYRQWEQSYSVYDGVTLSTDGHVIDENTSLTYDKPDFGYGGVAGLKFNIFGESGIKLDATYQLGLDGDHIGMLSGGVYFRF